MDLTEIMGKAEDPPWVDRETAMRMLGLKNRATLQSLCDKGKIESAKVNAKVIMYRKKSIEDFLSGQT